MQKLKKHIISLVQYIKENDRVEKVDTDPSQDINKTISLIIHFSVITIALLAIVFCNTMVARARQDVGNLRREVSALKTQAEYLEKKYESGINYLEVYKIATEDLGMIDARFVQSSYLNDNSASYIEVFQDEKESLWDTIIDFFK